MYIKNMPEYDERRDIAIVGMSVYCPGGDSLDEFWRSLSGGVDCIADAPPNIIDSFYFEGGERGSIDHFYCKRGGFCPTYKIDPLRYGFVPITVDGLETEQLYSLAGVDQALIDAGVPGKGISLENASIIIGRGGFSGSIALRAANVVRTSAQIAELIRIALPDIPDGEIAKIKKAFQGMQGRYQADTAIGTMPNLIASLVANKFNMHGPAYTIDGACASALIAVDHSAALLRGGACDVAVAGGTHLLHNAMFWSAFNMMGALSQRERIAPFSADADGLLIGQGAGYVVLKTLRRALEDGDRVYAVIKATSVSSDGGGSHVMVTSTPGQKRALDLAWSAAGMDRELLGYVEAHGTGTPAGDRTEMASLTEFFGDSSHPAAYVGSVKSNIGHAMPAAGIMGLIKTALALHYRQIPPTLHCETPLREMAESRFEAPAGLVEWDGERLPLVAGVNAFGFGGINAHAILTAYEPQAAATGIAGASWAGATTSPDAGANGGGEGGAAGGAGDGSAGVAGGEGSEAPLGVADGGAAGGVAEDAGAGAGAGDGLAEVAGGEAPRGAAGSATDVASGAEGSGGDGAASGDGIAVGLADGKAAGRAEGAATAAGGESPRGAADGGATGSGGATASPGAGANGGGGDFADLRRGRKRFYYIDEALAVSAKSKAALIKKLEAGDFTDTGGDYRMVVFRPDGDRVRQAIRVAESDRPWRGRLDIWFSNRPLLSSGGKIAFLFPGYSSDTAAETKSLEDCFGYALPDMDLSDSNETDIQGIMHFYAMMFNHMALADLGVKGDMYVGHSIGEWHAARAAGLVSDSFERETAKFVTRLKDSWDKTLSDAPKDLGELFTYYIAIGNIGPEKIGSLLAAVPGLYLANDNCPSQVIMCGKSRAKDALVKILEGERIYHQVLEFYSGFHTPLLESEQLGWMDELLGGLEVYPTDVPLWTSATLSRVPTDREGYARHFKYQLLNPQYFRGLIEKLYDEEGARVFVQIGMGRLTGFVENILQGKEHGAVATGSAARDGAGQLRRALALLFVEGRGVDSGFLGVKPQYRVASHSVIPIPVGSPIVREFPLLREIVQKRYAPIGRQAGAAGAGVAGATAGAAVANAASRSAAVAGATSAKSAGATANTKATGAGAANAGAVAAGSAAGAVAGSAGAGTTARSAAGAARVAANAGSAAGSATGTAGAGAASAAVNAVAAGAMANTKATGTGAANVGAVAARSAVSTGVAAANVGTATNAGAANAGAAANAVAAGAMANTKATGTGAANVGAVAARLAASTGVAAANVGTAANAGAANAGAANAGAANARIAGAAVNAAAASVAMASAAMASAAANLAAYVAASAGAQPAGPRWPDAAPRDCGAPVLVAACDNLAGAAMYEIDRLCGGGAWLADAYPVAAAAAGHAPGLAAPAQMAPARGPSPGAAWPASPSAPMPGLPMPNAAQPDRAGAPPPATSMPASAPTVSTPAPMPASAPGAPPPATSLPGAPAPAPASPPATLAPAPAASLPGAPMPTPAPASATAASRPATPVPASASTPPPAAPAPASAPAPMPGLARPAVTPVRPAGAPARRGATATKSGAAFEQPLRLTLEEHPYLLDHAIVRQPEGWMYKEDLNPVVPFTMMIELLAEVALARAPGRKIVKIGPARAYRWISVETPFEAAIVGKWKSADRLALAIKGYADAEFTLGGAYPEPPPEYGADPDMGEALMPPLEKEEAYEKYAFHGPAYHSNEKFVTITKKGMLFTSRRAAGKASLLDGAGQALGLYLHLTQAANTISFPTRVKEMVFYQDMFDQSGEFDVAMFATLTDNLSIGDFVMRRGGRPWMSARGWVGQRFENDRSMWNVLLRPQRYLMARELAPGAGAYYYSNYYDRAANWLMLLKRYLNRPEALRYGGLGSARQKLEYLIGAIALKDAVRKFLGGEAYAYPVEIFYEHDESGRPRVRGVGELGERLAGVHVSIARKGSLVVAIASGKPVGIDLELIGEPKPEAFTESVFAPRERELLGEMGASERAEWTARLRVAKEAYAKMAGTGLDENPRQFEAAPLPAGAAGAGAESAGAGAGDNAESAGAGEGEESAGAGAGASSTGDGDMAGAACAESAGAGVGAESAGAGASSTGDGDIVGAAGEAGATGATGTGEGATATGGEASDPRDIAVMGATVRTVRFKGEYIAGWTI